MRVPIFFLLSVIAFAFPLRVTKAEEISILLEYAKAGDVGAQVAAADIYFESGEYKKAFDLYLNAADQYDATAESSVGVYYYWGGLGVDQNYTTAFQFFQRAAAKEDVVAFRFLSLAYYYGHGVQQNYYHSLYWLDKFRLATLKNKK